MWNGKKIENKNEYLSELWANQLLASIYENLKALSVQKAVFLVFIKKLKWKMQKFNKIISNNILPVTLLRL